MFIIVGKFFKMKYKNLGFTSLKVSQVCLGTMTFGDQTSEKDSFRIMDFVKNRGVNFLIQQRCIQLILKKQLKEILKELLVIGLKKKKIRHKIILATKISSGHPKGIGATGLKWIRKRRKTFKV